MRPNPRWIGVVVTPPEIGAPLIVGRPGARDVTITSLVRQLFARDDGVLVQTEHGSRYFIEIGGHTYRCQCVPDQPEHLAEPMSVAVPHTHRRQRSLPPPLPPLARRERHAITVHARNQTIPRRVSSAEEITVDWQARPRGDRPDRWSTIDDAT